MLSLLKLLPLFRYQVLGHSMEPSLKSGQIVWVFSWAYIFSSPKEGDIVVFQKDNQELIKRIRARNNGEFELVGDNRDHSYDSRKFGLVKKSSIIGKVVF